MMNLMKIEMESRVRQTMREIGIRNREKTSLDNTQCLIQWLAETHPEAKRGTCQKCGTVIDYDIERAKVKERDKEKVEFT